MKAEVREEDVVKHWGLYNTVTDEWLTSEEGLIFAATCPRVANAQLDIVVKELNKFNDSNDVEEEDLEVREIK